MSTERDELATVVENTDMLGCGCCAGSSLVGGEFRQPSLIIADAILNAGYRKQESK